MPPAIVRSRGRPRKINLTPPSPAPISVIVTVEQRVRELTCAPPKAIGAPAAHVDVALKQPLKSVAADTSYRVVPLGDLEYMAANTQREPFVSAHVKVKKIAKMGLQCEARWYTDRIELVV